MHFEDRRRTAFCAEADERYFAAFGCRWDKTPTGECWGDLLEAARAADAEYKAELAHLRDACRVIRHLVSKVDSEHPGSRTFGDIAPGRTLPEIFNVMLAASIPDLGELGTRLDEFLRLADGLEPVLADAIRDPIVTEMAGAMAARSVGTVDADALASLRRNTLTATRRYREQQLQTLTGETIDISLVPGLPGPPPEKGTPGDDTWRRNHIVRVLDGYPMTTRIDSEGRIKPVPPTDDEIALVTLLAFRIKSLPESSLRLRFDDVLGGERKAIHMARPRQGLVSRLMAAGGGGSLHRVATGLTPKKQRRRSAKPKER